MVTYALSLRAMNTLHEKVSLHICKSNSTVPTRGSEASLLWAKETQNECLTPLLCPLVIGRSFGHIRAPAASSGVPGPSCSPGLGGIHRDVPIDPEEMRVQADLPAPGDAPPGRVGVAEAHFSMRSWTPRGAGDLPRQGRSREAPRRRRVAARSQHAARIRRGDPGRQVPCHVCRARAGDVAAQVDARGRPRRRPRVQMLTASEINQIGTAVGILDRDSLDR